MTQLDKESYLKKMKNKIINQEVIHLIEEDLDKGLTASEIDDYATRGLNLQQMKAVSAMYHKKFPIGVIATIGGLNVDAEKMLVATQLYENGVAIEDIETALGGTKTAHDMRIAFSNVLSKVQEGLAITEDAVKEAEKEDSKKEERPAYVAELLEQLKSVVQKINYQDERYDAFNEKLKEFETAKRDEVVEKNLTSLNEKLEKENRELSEQLAGKQDEIAKGLQTVSKLRSEIDKIREEKNKMEKLREQYEKEVIPALMKKFEYKSVMQVPKLDKIVINIGLGDVKENPKSLENAMKDLEQITGQRPVVTKAKKSIAAFKLREGVNVGCKVTLRSDKMYDFAYKLFNVALPRVRDFRGVSGNSFDGRGNYSMGIKEQLIFPEIEYDKVDKLRGMDIIFVTTAETDEESKELLKLLGMPFNN